MKTLFVSAARPFNAETEQSLFLAAALAARGHACRWMAPPGSGSLMRAADAGLPVTEFPGTHFGNNPLRFAAQWRALRREVRRFGPDVIYTVESPAHLLGALVRGAAAGAPGATGGRRGRPAALVRWRGSNTPLRRRPGSRALYDRDTRFVLVPCARLAEEARAAGFHTRHWRVLDGCVDGTRFCPGPAEASAWMEAGLGPGAEVVALTARLAPVKGVGIFLEALERVRRTRPRVAAVLMGEAWEGQEAAYRDGVARLGLEGAAHWLGRREDVVRWLRLARVGVVSSVGSELHSRAALEYMACGLPVAATRVGVLPEWLEGRPWARLAPPGDAAGLAEAIVELLSDPAREELGAAARAEALTRFSPARFTSEVEAVLLEAAGAGE
ncbi:MAG: glycosyltransferase family 4 protein [Candidatus Eisenbacteria bacterium]|nr:glycosyltransferase family 4 protein [Candidatus Eisenbacteria bacterium]